MTRYCCNCRRCRGRIRNTRNNSLAGGAGYEAGFGFSDFEYSFRMLILLILVILQFGRGGQSGRYKDGNYGNGNILDNSILFIIVFFFLVCGCGYGQRYGY